ncbi:MAG: ATP-binding protein [Oscillospiraceae bacterium]|nr:ATP-binding protein [Oscillospiraceae bacterium]
MNGVSFNFTVPGDDFTRAGEASSAIKNKLKSMGIPPAVVRNVAIAVYEGEINMVIHAPGNGRPGGGIITITVEPEAITMVLEDKGRGIEDVDKAMQEGYTTAADEVRALGFGAGMGLPNMKNYSDEFAITSTVGVGTTVTMKIYLNK